VVVDVLERMVEGIPVAPRPPAAPGDSAATAALASGMAH